MSKIVLTEKHTIEKPKNLDQLKTVPFENVFHFYTELEKNTGITARSLIKFNEKVQIVSIQSATFHFHRQDFQKWLKNNIGSLAGSYGSNSSFSNKIQHYRYYAKKLDRTKPLKDLETTLKNLTFHM